MSGLVILGIVAAFVVGLIIIMVGSYFAMASD